MHTITIRDALVSDAADLTALYNASVLRSISTFELHTAIGGVALPNPASVRLHEGFGFHAAGRFREVGRRFGEWMDAGYWPLCLDAARDVPAGA